MTDSTIRTRYAPSPTGYLHVGGLRTALYNYLYARQKGGKIILRIEDTDRTRLVEGATENLLDIFDWLGLIFDEGPRIGGEFGPYIQSERLDIYNEHIQILADKNLSYPCFCTSERLERMRADQELAKIPPMYDRTCRKLAKDEVKKRMEAGEPHVWRLAVPDGETIKIHDVIRGEVQFESATVDDQVLMKSDGYPTYHLANVVDDHAMKISHVIRGEEWLPSTPKHVLLYRSFGWSLPTFAHLPLLLNPDRSKMSKRSGDVAVEAYKQKGILAEVLINFVALLGWHPVDDREIFSLEELVKEFSLERVNKAGAVFDTAKLSWMNTEYIAKESEETLFSHVAPLLSDSLSNESRDRIRYAVITLRAGAGSYDEIARKVEEVFAPSGEPAVEMLPLLEPDASLNFVREFAEKLSSLPASVWNDFERLAIEFKEKAKVCGDAAGLKGKSLWQTLRAALTGQPHGPELAKLIGIWGRERTLNQLDIAMQWTTRAEPK